MYPFAGRLTNRSFTTLAWTLGSSAWNSPRSIPSLAAPCTSTTPNCAALGAALSANRTGVTVSITKDWLAGAEALPAASVAIALTAKVPSPNTSVPLLGVAVARSTLQVPCVPAATL